MSSESPSLAERLAAHADDALLQALGLPAHDASQPALTALHAGAAFHRLAMLAEVAGSYRAHARLAPDELPFLALIDRAAGRAAPRATAAAYYRLAATAEPQLAEAWYGLARLDEHRGAHDAALENFTRAAELPPHARSPGTAQLRANALYGRACALEMLGRDEEALAAYRAALRLLDNFGVHHRRIAAFLRRHGTIEEAVAAYEKLMAYGHRYFPEFTLPPLAPPPKPPAAPERLEALYVTSDGASVVFCDGAYFRVDPSLMPVTADTVRRQGGAAPGGRVRSVLDRLMRAAGLAQPSQPKPSDGRIRRADNMAAFEPGGA